MGLCFFVKSAGQSVTPALPRTSAHDAEQDFSFTWANARRPARRGLSATKHKGNALPVRIPVLFWVGFCFLKDGCTSARFSLQSARQTVRPVWTVIRARGADRACTCWVGDATTSAQRTTSPVTNSWSAHFKVSLSWKEFGSHKNHAGLKHWRGFFLLLLSLSI